MPRFASRFGVGASALVLGLLVSAPAAAQSRPITPPEHDYIVRVVSESSDDVSRVRFGPGGAKLEKAIKTGLMLTEINGPHGIAVSPDHRFYYVSVAHGTPFGTLWKYDAATDTVAGRTTLGRFPASVTVTPDGNFAYAVNFNVHGDMVPSSVSVVYTPDMLEVARITTCTMPHGSRISPDGSRHYSTCMMDDMLVEIDTRTLAVARHFNLRKGAEHGATGAPMVAGAGDSTHAEHAAHAGGAAAPHAGMSMEPTCSPTWAQPSADGARVYVACNKSNDIVEIDVEDWTLRRRIPAGPGVYNLAVSPDGRLLLATNKKGQSVSVIEIASGRELARIPTKRQVVHGVVVSPDSRYAFVTVEGIGAEPGTLEVIDLRALASVAQVDLGQQAAGVDFDRIER